MWLLKAILIVLILLWAGGFRDWGWGKWYGGNGYVAWGVGTLILVLTGYLLFRR